MGRLYGGLHLPRAVLNSQVLDYVANMAYMNYTMTGGQCGRVQKELFRDSSETENLVLAHIMARKTIKECRRCDMRELISNVLNREAEAIRELVFSLDEAQVDAVTETNKKLPGQGGFKRLRDLRPGGPGRLPIPYAVSAALHFLSRPQTRFTADWV